MGVSILNDCQKSRIEWLDMVRSLAIFSVVLCHVTENIYFSNAVAITDRSVSSQLLGFAFFTVGRIGVPLFLMITGYLLLDRKYNSNECTKFWKHNLMPLLLVTQVWSIIFHIFLCFYCSQPMDIWKLIKEIFFLKSVDMPHTWYLPMIIGIYIAIPFVGIALEKIENKLLVIPFLITLIYFYLIPSINILLVLKGITPLENKLYLYYTGGVYGIYLMIGYLIKKGLLKKVKKVYFVLAFFALFIGIVTFQLCVNNLGGTYRVWYDFILLPFAAAALFSTLYETKPGKFLARACYEFSRCSFGIYLVHSPIQKVIIKFVRFEFLPTPLRVCVMCLAVFLVSWGMVRLIMKVPKIGNKLVFVR